MNEFPYCSPDFSIVLEAIVTIYSLNVVFPELRLISFGYVICEAAEPIHHL